MSRKIPAHIAPAVATELSVLAGAERSIRVCELAERYGCSVKTINAITRKYGLRARAQRSDSGKSECPIDVVRLVATGALVGFNLKGQFTSSIKHTMKMLRHEGVTIPVSYSRMCQLLKEHGYSRADIAARDPHREMCSLYPNHVWQFDVSNCHQWHLEHGTGLEDIWDIDLRIYKNKMQEHFKKNPRQLRRYVMIDHWSGAFYFQYFYAAGERAEDGAKFFYNAFANKEFLLENSLGVVDSPYQFSGVPDMLVSDKGSILQNGLMKTLMANLGVQVELHQAGAPWAKGSVEGLMHIIGTHFEPYLKYKRPESLEELNQWALAWCIDYNFEGEFRGSTESRHELWHKKVSSHLRNCPNYQVYTSLQQLKEEERTVTGSCIISYDGKKFFIPSTDAAYRKVTVAANAYEYPSVTVKCPWDGSVYVVPPLETGENNRLVSPQAAVFGSYVGLNKTQRQRAKEELEIVATERYGTTWKGNAAKRQAVAPVDGALPGGLAHALNEAISNDVPQIPLAGHDITVPDIHAPIEDAKVKPITAIKAPRAVELVPTQDVIRLYHQQYGRMMPELRDAIVAHFPAGVPVTMTLSEVLYIAQGGETHVKQA